jgi:imidazolonepropionase-like amidohydrolase
MATDTGDVRPAIAAERTTVRHGLVIDWTDEALACECGWEPDQPFGQAVQYDEHLAEAAVAAMQERRSHHAYAESTA